MSVVRIDSAGRVPPGGDWKAPVLISSTVYRKALIGTCQVGLFIAAYYASFLFRLDFSLKPVELTAFERTLPLVILVKLLVFAYFGLFRGWWQYVGFNDLLDITKASFVSFGVLSVILYFVDHINGFPRSVTLLDLCLTILATGGARFAARAYTENVHRYVAQKRTLVVGAGSAGRAIVRELISMPAISYAPIGFADDDPKKRSAKFHGVRVLGTLDDIPELISEHNVACVLITIPRAEGQSIERIVRSCRQYKIDFKLLDSIADRISRRTVTQVRDVRVEDLLGRPPVHLDVDQIAAQTEGKVVLVTGAGGSIGGELCRQVAAFRPRELVLFERSEGALFSICMELASKFSSVKVVPIVGDILDVCSLREAFARHRPHSVFHAAAYKHVPMMERNCFQAVANNVFGTYNTALMAREYMADEFVLISSDKAVNPANIMGATKRIAELIVLALQPHNTRFVVVRFGNVLGSSGSVLPIFKEQLAAGGPLTVTHPEMTRYFMTIPEAVQLVLQASAMGKCGQIMLLDMGEPVKIVDLANNLIRLSGFEPGREVQVQFIGLRPGEKLTEELSVDGEGVLPTSHEKIQMLRSCSVNFKQVRTWLDELAELDAARNFSGLISKLQEIVPEYTPSEQVLGLCELDRHDRSAHYRIARHQLDVPPDAMSQQQAA